ncbi:heme-binding protein [Mesorhizobium sp. M7A.F.Ca.US.006.01.1.1]|uniref:GlcG/HbpS family heme-binding protein n=1 Tax=Mesorhizobium sp. M7A.F.Ca.US.006.01.1.1 TaxID=2496707 RepID=UPI0019CF81B3|nr:heme-binding protein [Mesorhizobium sp. M7A.F.Ca.US.006.01.1.1]
MKTFAYVSLAIFTLGSVASAEELHERNISLATATELAQKGVKACSSKGYNVSVAVVDRAGVLRSLMRADGAGPHTVGAAQAKAFTAASGRALTSAMAKTVQENPGAAGLVDIPGYLVLAGGVPIKIGDETIGAIGIGGAPGGNLDEECAQAAVEKIKDKLN